MKWPKQDIRLKTKSESQFFLYKIKKQNERDRIDTTSQLLYFSVLSQAYFDIQQQLKVTVGFDNQIVI